MEALEPWIAHALGFLTLGQHRRGNVTRGLELESVALTLLGSRENDQLSPGSTLIGRHTLWEFDGDGYGHPTGTTRIRRRMVRLVRPAHDGTSMDSHAAGTDTALVIVSIAEMLHDHDGSVHRVQIPLESTLGLREANQILGDVVSVFAEEDRRINQPPTGMGSDNLGL